MDIRVKKQLVQSNIYNCKFGMYKILPIGKTQKNFYSFNFALAPPYEYCNVEVKPIHILETSYEYVKQGFKTVMLTLVDSEFTMNNNNAFEYFRDEQIFFRTNINAALLGFNLLPVKGTEALYSPIIHIIRNDNMQLLRPSDVVKVAIITASLKRNPVLIADHINLDDYMTTVQLLETIFQTAHLAGNEVLVLNDFGCISDGYPVNDVIDIINGCIYKYGHLFRHIVIAINVTSQATMGYYSKINDGIVRPQAFLNEFVPQEEIDNDIQEPFGIYNSNNNTNQNEFNPFAELILN